MNKTKMFMLKVKRFFILVLFWLCVGAMAFGIFMAGRYLYPTTVYTKQEVIKEVDRDAPVLARIAGCESQGNPKSPGTHFAKNGQVLLSPNKNGSVDVGVMQINDDVWGATATQMGLNITIEKDNRAMAKWIYENRGTEDWSASAKCWR